MVNFGGNYDTSVLQKSNAYVMAPDQLVIFGGKFPLRKSVGLFSGGILCLKFVSHLRANSAKGFEISPGFTCLS